MNINKLCAVYDDKSSTISCLIILDSNQLVHIFQVNKYIPPYAYILYLFNALSDMLLTEPIDNNETVLPSPHQLRRKIILKVCLQ